MYTCDTFGDGSLVGPVGPWPQVGWAAVQCKEGAEQAPTLAVTSPMECMLPVQKGQACRVVGFPPCVAARAAIHHLHNGPHTNCGGPAAWQGMVLHSAQGSCICMATNRALHRGAWRSGQVLCECCAHKGTPPFAAYREALHYRKVSGTRQ